MRRRSFSSVLERMRGGHDVDCAIGTQRFHEAIEQSRLGERLVALDIYNKTKLSGFPGDFGNSIGPALVLRQGHRYLRAPSESRFGDPHVIGGDDDCIQFLRPTTTFPNVSKKRFVCNKMQWFSRETRRLPSCRNNPNSLHFVAFRMISAPAGRSSATHSAQLPAVVLSKPVRTRIARRPALWAHSASISLSPIRNECPRSTSWSRAASRTIPGADFRHCEGWPPGSGQQ